MADGAAPHGRARPRSGSSPICGHLYERASYDKPDQRYAGRATATWTVEWTAPALGDAGTLTEVRETAFTVRVVEMQALNVR